MGHNCTARGVSNEEEVSNQNRGSFRVQRQTDVWERKRGSPLTAVGPVGGDPVGSKTKGVLKGTRQKWAGRGRLGANSRVLGMK